MIIRSSFKTYRAWQLLSDSSLIQNLTRPPQTQFFNSSNLQFFNSSKPNSSSSNSGRGTVKLPLRRWDILGTWAISGIRWFDHLICLKVLDMIGMVEMGLCLFMCDFFRIYANISIFFTLGYNEPATSGGGSFFDPPDPHTCCNL